jgi:hypothetical protein
MEVPFVCVCVCVCVCIDIYIDIYRYENSIMKPQKNILKEGKREKVLKK